MLHEPEIGGDQGGDHMLGRIEKVWQNEAQNKQPYLVLEIDGQRYSLWDENWIDKLQEGDIVEYDWKKAGKFRNITSIEQVNASAASSGSKEKDQHILRMSCLKSASTIFSGLDAEPKKKVRLTVAAARHFEKYINDSLPEKPAGNSRAKDYHDQGGDDDLEL